MSLPGSSIKILKATRGLLRKHGHEITSTMYEIMMEKYPVVKNHFNQSHLIKDENGFSPQAGALAVSLIAYAENCDNLGALSEAVEMIAEKHVSFNITRDMYPIVAECLLQAMKDVLKSAATDEVMKGWADAYWFLADLLIGIEEKKMVEREALKGGWRGFQKLQVTKKIKESDNVTSFCLQHVGGEGLPDGFKPGQYLSFRIPKDEIGLDYDLVRNYSLSCMPGKGFYRVSIKRVVEGHAGVVSNYFHDKIRVGSEVEVGMPAGSFLLDEKDERPVLLIAAGIGLTPMISMLEFLAAKHKGRHVTYFQSCRSISEHPMKQHVGNIAVANPNIKAHVFYTREVPSGNVENMDVHQGRITQEKFMKLVPQPFDGNKYYFCGPKSFQDAMINILKTLQVPQNQVHSEDFGPTTH